MSARSQLRERADVMRASGANRYDDRLETRVTFEMRKLPSERRRALTHDATTSEVE